ncbi:MAG: hypothetical protein V1929_01775 [bacterium]
MITWRHALSVLALFLALCGPAFAGDVELFTTGTNDTLGFRLKNTSAKMRYSVNIEVTRVHLKTGDTISTRTDQHTLEPLADMYIGPARQQGAAVRYRIASIRLAGGQTGNTGARRSGSLPAPYPITFGK